MRPPRSSNLRRSTSIARRHADESNSARSCSCRSAARTGFNANAGAGSTSPRYLGFSIAVLLLLVLDVFEYVVGAILLFLLRFFAHTRHLLPVDRPSSG